MSNKSPCFFTKVNYTGKIIFTQGGVTTTIIHIMTKQKIVFLCNLRIYANNEEVVVVVEVVVVLKQISLFIYLIQYFIQGHPI